MHSSLDEHLYEINYIIQTGDENWIHFSAFAQKMELQKKMYNVGRTD
jgi:hypothetical protein